MTIDSDADDTYIDRYLKIMNMIQGEIQFQWLGEILN